MKIFAFLGKLNNLVWSVGRKQTTVEIITIQMTSSLTSLRLLKRHIQKAGSGVQKQELINNSSIRDFFNEPSTSQDLESSKQAQEYFRSETWKLFTQYLSLKFAASLSLVTLETILADKVVTDIIKCEFFGNHQKIENFVSSSVVQGRIIFDQVKASRQKQEELKNLIEKQLKEESFTQWVTRVSSEIKQSSVGLLKKSLFRKRVGFGLAVVAIFLLVKK